jgi:hypothetical protein
MIRGLFIAMNFFVVWLFGLLAGVPSATVTTPDKVNKGESITVNVKINPNGVEDFLRYSMEIPEGWTAEKISEDGSSFMFEKQAVKFLWSRVGQRNELNISFKLTPPADAEGSFEFKQKLSHSVNNLPSHVQLDPAKVIVGNAGSPNNNYVPENTDSTAKPNVTLSAARVVPTETVTGEFVVDVTINKGDLGSFIKLQDSLPAGFTAKPVLNDGGDWSFENGIVRIQWYSPNKANTTLHAQYKVIVSPDMSGRYTINGHISYVENMDNKLVNLAPSSIELKANQALVDNTNNGNNTNNGTNANNGNNGNNGNDGNKTQDPLTNNNGNNGNNGNANNGGMQQDPNTNKTQGVSYSIQVAAMLRRVSTDYYENTYGLGTVNAEQIDGLNKYTTGSYTTYQDARNNRETVRNKGVAGPFVVAYNSGKRITVQEALMITSQKWIQ